MDYTTMDALLRACLDSSNTAGGVDVDAATLEVLETRLSDFVNRTQYYMLANVNADNHTVRVQYITNVIGVILKVVMPRHTVQFQPIDGKLHSAWVFPVENYTASKFIRVKGLGNAYAELDTKTNDPNPEADKTALQAMGIQNAAGTRGTYMAHSLFINALAKLSTLDVFVKNGSRAISSYSHVIMFFATMERIIAKLGSVFIHTDDNRERTVFSVSVDVDVIRIDRIVINHTKIPWTPWPCSINATCM
jgi:hypothetical protein